MSRRRSLSGPNRRDDFERRFSRSIRERGASFRPWFRTHFRTRFRARFSSQFGRCFRASFRSSGRLESRFATNSEVHRSSAPKLDFASRFSIRKSARCALRIIEAVVASKPHPGSLPGASTEAAARRRQGRFRTAGSREKSPGTTSDNVPYVRLRAQIRPGNGVVASGRFPRLPGFQDAWKPLGGVPSRAGSNFEIRVRSDGVATHRSARKEAPIR